MYEMTRHADSRISKVTQADNAAEAERLNSL